MKAFRSHLGASGLVGLALLLVLVTVALVAPLVAQHSPTAVPRGAARLPPSAEHWFGTDQIGRDVFARVVYGSRVSLLVGIGATLIASIGGILIGALAGYRGGWVDSVLMRSTEVVLVFPGVVLAGLLVIALGGGAPTMVLVLGIVLMPVIARVARSSVMEARQADYVEAARSLGCTHVTILLRHVLPVALAPVVTLATMSVGTAILAEATLSYLSIGVTEPTPSWGLMIAGGQRFLATSPHVVVFPALAIFVTVLAFVLVAGGKGSRVDVRSKRGCNA